jgi:hypothetical protein
LEYRVNYLEYRVKGLECRVNYLEYRVKGLGG